MKCTYYRPEEVNCEEFAAINEKLAEDLEYLCGNTIDKLEVIEYVWTLAQQAKPLTHSPSMAFFGFDDPENMPSDVRVDFFYKPTYYAVAIMVKAIVLYPELLECGECADLLKKNLPLCLNGCTGKKFFGHGYEADAGLLETMLIFGKADVKNFIETYPEMCPKFNSVYRQAIRHLREMSDEDYHGAWGEKYAAQAREVLKQNGVSWN